MRDFFKYAKAWALVAMVTRAALVLCVLLFVLAVLFGSGGEVKLAWSFQ
jgi:hypothetical protein